MNQPTNKKIYNGFSDCLVMTVKQDGVLALWRGFVYPFGRGSTLQLLTLEYLYGVFGFKSI
jgi:hypothetical protein